MLDSVRENLTGKVFGDLTVLRLDYGGQGQNRHYRWWVRCSCGAVKSVNGGKLKSGNTKSCGCLRKISGRKIEDGMIRDFKGRFSFFAAEVLEGRALSASKSLGSE